VISDALWTAFGRPDDIVGREIRIGERVHVVAGVGPAGFRGLELARPCDVWVPLDTALRVSRVDRRLSIVARLADGADVDAAQRQAAALAQRLATEFPDTNRGARGNASAPRRLSVRPYSRVDPSASGPLVLLGTAALGATVLLLVSACVNAASVLVSRSAARRRELAVKVALGASRARLVRQTLVEGWLLASLGAALGLLLAHYTAAILPSRFTPEEAEMLRLTVDTRIVAALIVFAIAAGALFAVGPARHVIGTRDIEALRAGTGQVSMSHGRTSIRRLVVIRQIALSAVILVATGVLVGAMSMALDGGTAGAGRRLAIALVEIPGDRLGSGGADIDYPGRAREAIRKLSDVVDAGWVMTLPLRQPGSERFAIEAPQGLVETIDVDINTAPPDYFATMGMALVEGRTFDAGDRPRSGPVVVVNDVLAQRYFGGAAIDQYLREHNGAADRGPVRLRTAVLARAPHQPHHRFAHGVRRAGGRLRAARAALDSVLMF
jgi:putative ABC transport system permease protein